MPYKSEKQRRFMHWKHPRIARRWDEEYGGKVAKAEEEFDYDKYYPRSLSRNPEAVHVPRPDHVVIPKGMAIEDVYRKNNWYLSPKAKKQIRGDRKRQLATERLKKSLEARLRQDEG